MTHWKVARTAGTAVFGSLPGSTPPTTLPSFSFLFQASSRHPFPLASFSTRPGTERPPESTSHSTRASQRKVHHQATTAEHRQTPLSSPLLLAPSTPPFPAPQPPIGLITPPLPTPPSATQPYQPPAVHMALFDDHLELTWPDGASHKYSHFWLRDNCPCPRCLHPETLQRQVETLLLPDTISPTKAEVTMREGVEKSLRLVWPDGHETEFKLQTLRSLAEDYRRNPTSTPAYRISAEVPIHWNSEVISRRFPELTYDRVMSGEQGLLEWLELIQKYGFALVKGTPPTAEATQQLAEKITFLRSTMFGTFWDYTISSSEDWKLQHSDTAYTNLTIDPHTDGSYYLDSPGLQFFHVLDFHGTGGSTVLVDGFRVGDILKRNNPEAFEFLSSNAMFFRYVEKEKINVVSPHTVFRLNDSGEYVQFRFNNHDRAPNYLPPDIARRFYTSIKALSRELQNPVNQVRFVLQPGTLLVTNNWRVLHARDEFRGSRRICGCYLGIEDFHSRLRVLRSRVKGC